MPRTLLVIDEFQEFFVEDDKIAQEAALLLDRLVRQGRAFGIHVLLGSQTLGGAYTLAKSTMGQMAVRIALQCSEADSHLIMNEDNSAARLLARPGEGIYNDASGLIEGNSPFQVVWLPDHERERCLRQIASLSQERGRTAAEPIVFEGNVAADVRRNRQLEAWLESSSTAAAGDGLFAWLGEAVAIKDPTAAIFRRQTGSNLLLVGQRDESGVALMTIAMISLAAQLQSPEHSFRVLSGFPPDAPHRALIDRVTSMLGPAAAPAGAREVPELLQTLADEVDRRHREDVFDAPPLYLVILGLQRFRDLRATDDFSFSMSSEEKPTSPDKLFKTILTEGPPVGVHVLVWCDTATNVDRSLDRQSMREFDLRIVFQMSATDSTNLIDSPAAHKLGLHHAYFYSEEQGILEKFRPYGLPDESWLDRVEEGIRGRRELGFGCSLGCATRRHAGLRGQRRLLSKRCANTPGVVEGVREHDGVVPGVAGPSPHPCGLVLVGLRLDARLEVLFRRRRIHAARPSSVRRCSYAPASCGLPCGWSSGGHFYSCAARPGRRGFAIAGGILPPRFSLRTTTRSAASCRRPSVPDGNGLLCTMRRLRSIASATPPFAPAAQASAGQAPAAGSRGSVGVCA